MGNTNEKRIEIVIEIDENGCSATQSSTGNVNASEIMVGYIYAANSLAEAIAKHDGAPKEHVLDKMAIVMREIACNPDMVQKADEGGVGNGND